MTDIIQKQCKCCTASFSTRSSDLEFCSATCVETFYRIQQEELLVERRRQLAALLNLDHICLVCGTQIQALTQRKTVKLYCSASCTLRAIPRTQKVVKPCVHCDVDVSVLWNMRDEFVRCDKHRNLWPKVRHESAQNMKKVKVAVAPYDQYLLRGPWWNHKSKTWTVLLMHSGASSQREMEYARYLLSVKEGKRLNDSVPLVYIDGDRTNVEVSNLALG